MTNTATAKKRILIAEDDAAIAKLLERTLSRRYDVQVADDGASALAMATKPPHPDLIVLDIMMPTIDGLGVAQRLKLFPQLARVPLVFLTARGAPLDKIRGIQLGARHYITKPFKLTELVAKIDSLLGE